MEHLIKEAFMHVEVIGPHVDQGHYDLLGPQGEILLPNVWDTVVEPDWTITMHMWPMTEEKEEEGLPEEAAIEVIDEGEHSMDDHCPWISSILCCQSFFVLAWILG